MFSSGAVRCTTFLPFSNPRPAGFSNTPKGPIDRHLYLWLNLSLVKMPVDLIRFLSVLLLFAAALTHASAGEIEIVRDEPYKPDGETAYERERCRLDWYLPKDTPGFATLVWFHGGDLQNGHKADEIASALAERFAADGIAVASVNYRLSPKANYPAYVEDAAAAVAHVLRTVGSYRGSENQVFVSGHSAGGYLTAMLGVAAGYLKDRSTFTCGNGEAS